MVPCDAGYWCSSPRESQCFKGMNFTLPIESNLSYAFLLLLFFLYWNVVERLSWRRSWQGCTRSRTRMQSLYSNSEPILEVGSHLGLVWSMTMWRVPRSLSLSTDSSGYNSISLSALYFFFGSSVLSSLVTLWQRCDNIRVVVDLWNVHIKLIWVCDFDRMDLTRRLRNQGNRLRRGRTEPRRSVVLRRWEILTLQPTFCKLFVLCSFFL